MNTDIVREHARGNPGQTVASPNSGDPYDETSLDVQVNYSVELNVRRSLLRKARLVSSPGKDAVPNSIKIRGTARTGECVPNAAADS
jgi:hypothetical protein